MTARTSRPTMTKRLIAPVAVMATIPAVLALALPAQAASEVTEPQCETSGARLGSWQESPSVTVQHGDPTAPMDPDGSSDESDPANLTKSIELSPVKHVTQDHVPATQGDWDDSTTTVYSWNGGPSASAPQVFIDSSGTTINPLWNPDNGNHNGQPHQQPARVPYQTGGGNDGDNASWFVRIGTWVPGKPEVQELSHLDYQWQEYTRTFTPASACTPEDVDEEQSPNEEQPANEEQPPTEDTPATSVTQSVPTEVKGQTALVPASASHQPGPANQSQASADNPAAVPLSIDAGL